MLGCQYQFIQEPLEGLYCRHSSKEIQVSCGIVSLSSLPRIARFDWFRQDTDMQTVMVNPINRRTRSRSNNTHSAIEQTIGISRVQQGRKYWCQPITTNNKRLKPSQALLIQPDVFFNAYLSCQDNDIFTTVSNRCADTSDVLPNSAHQSISTSSISSHTLSIPSHTNLKGTALLPTTTHHTTSTSTSTIPSPSNTNNKGMISSLTNKSVLTANTVIIQSISPTSVISCSSGSRVSGLDIFLPILSIALVIIMIQIVVHLLLIKRLLRKEKTINAPQQTMADDPQAFANISYQSSYDYHKNTVEGSSYTPEPYIYPRSIFPTQYQVNREQGQSSEDYSVYSIPQIPKVYTALVKKSIEPPNTYTSPLPTTDTFSN